MSAAALIMSLTSRRRRVSATLLNGLLLALLVLGQRTVAADAPISREYQIKAAFLYNIPKFVEWPAGSFADAGAPLFMCVLGQSPLSNQLQLTIGGRKINGRSLMVKQVETADEAKACHILFVGSDASQRFSLMYEELGDSAVLTVGESNTFIVAGGGIRFVPVGDKLRFEINMDSAERARLKISSQLQKLATSVRRER